MTKNIVVIGCGNIGSRHIQALTKLPFNIRLDLIEPNQDSRNLTKSRLQDVNHDNIEEMIWHNSIEEQLPKSDLVIVSTQSIGRATLIQNLLEKGHSRFLIEKIVCQSADEYEMLNTNFSKFNAKGWINTNRRYIEPYRQLKKCIKDDSFHMSVIAGDVGLGSNAYHFIDLFSWFSNGDDIFLNSTLDDKISFSKRGNSLLEFSGIITCNNNKSSLIISFFSSVNSPVMVELVTKDNHFIVNESTKSIISLNDETSLSYNFEMANVSNSTTAIADSILNNDDCELPKLKFGFSAHKELFNIFNNHVQLCKGVQNNLCPIS